LTHGTHHMSKKVAQVIVDTLKEAGVKNCYGIVGDTLNTFATALSKNGIEFVHVRHEEAGAFAAQGEALLLNRLTAVAGTAAIGRSLIGQAGRSVMMICCAWE